MLSKNTNIIPVHLINFKSSTLHSCPLQYVASAFVADAEFKREVEKLDKLVPKPKEPVCQHVSAKVAQCYSENGKQPLRCSDVVKEFAICVENHTIVSSASSFHSFMVAPSYILCHACIVIINVESTRHLLVFPERARVNERVGPGEVIRFTLKCRSRVATHPTLTDAYVQCKSISTVKCNLADGTCSRRPQNVDYLD